jgi:uncharacterized protein (TIGR02611 family)
VKSEIARWWTRWRERFRRWPAANAIYRLCVALVGAAVLAVGILAIPYPGPGWAVLFIGLGILASEFEWARRWLAAARRSYDQATAWLKRQPTWVRLLVSAVMFAVAVAALWLTGLFGWVAGFFGVGWPWLKSPVGPGA